MSQGLRDSLENVGCWSQWFCLGLPRKSFSSLLWFCFQTSDPMFASCWLHIWRFERFESFFWLVSLWPVYPEKELCLSGLMPLNIRSCCKSIQNTFWYRRCTFGSLEIIIKWEGNGFLIFYCKKKTLLTLGSCKPLWQLNLWLIFGWFKSTLPFRDPGFTWNNFGAFGAWEPGGGKGVSSPGRRCTEILQRNQAGSPPSSQEPAATISASDGLESAVEQNLKSWPPGTCGKSWLTVCVRKDHVL